MWAWCSPLHSPAPKHVAPPPSLPLSQSPSVSPSLPAVSLHPIMAPSSPPPLLDRTGSHAAAGHKRNVTGGCHENPHLWGTSTGTKAIDAREVDQGKRTLFSHPSSLFPPTHSAKLLQRTEPTPIQSRLPTAKCRIVWFSYRNWDCSTFSSDRLWYVPSLFEQGICRFNAVY